MVAKIMVVNEAWSQPISMSSPPNQVDARCKMDNMDEVVVMEDSQGVLPLQRHQ